MSEITRFYFVLLNVIRNLDKNINSFFISSHFFIFNQSTFLNVLIDVFKLIYFFKSFFILVWRLCHDIFDVINVNNERCWRVHLITQNVRRKDSSRNNDQDSCREKNRCRRVLKLRKSEDDLLNWFVFYAMRFVHE